MSTRIIHSDFRKLAIDLTRGMGLRLCGVDLLIKGGSIAESAKKFYVLEINSAPGLDHCDDRRRTEEDSGEFVLQGH